MLKIALPNKGRLAVEARELFNDAGLEVRAQSERALTASLGGEFQALFVRAQDIPEFVADGAADAGVTGWDLVCESERLLDSRLDLGFGKCRLVIAVREESPVQRVADFSPGTRVATVADGTVVLGAFTFAVSVIFVPADGVSRQKSDTEEQRGGDC